MRQSHYILPRKTHHRTIERMRIPTNKHKSLRKRLLHGKPATCAAKQRSWRRYAKRSGFNLEYARPSCIPSI